jgi:hypothetical protein
VPNVNRISTSIEKKNRTSFGPVRIYISVKKVLIDVIWAGKDLPYFAWQGMNSDLLLQVGF